MCACAPRPGRMRMRRKDREQCSKDFFDLVLARAKELFLAFFDAEFPYCIPVNFARQENNIYIHCATEGKKLELISRNNHVSFAMAIDIEIMPELATTYFKSVCGKGIASVISNEDEKRLALDALASRYHSSCKLPSSAALARVAIIKIEILELSGKGHIPPNLA